MLFSLLCSSSSPTSSLLSLTRTFSVLPRRPHLHPLLTIMSLKMSTHAFAGNPIKQKTPKSTDPFSPNSALKTLKTFLLSQTHLPNAPNFKFLPFQKGRPLAAGSLTPVADPTAPDWRLGWLDLGQIRAFLGNTEVGLSGDEMVYLGLGDSDGDGGDDVAVYWAVDLSEADVLVSGLGREKMCFVELRTLMVATDWSNDRAMAELAVAGHARALLEWHNVSRFCGHCGERTIPMEAGRRKQCTKESCKKRIYPRVDPVVIMLVIDKENDRVLLSRQSRFVPRMWSCLAGFIEPGESLEEAVRRETWEESGIEVGEVVYHSSQPWPVGPSSMPCQLMVGFFAYAKSLEINVDKEELEDAKWHSREEVKKALTFAEYEKAQKTTAAKVDQMCKGVERAQSLSSDFNIESGELAPMFIPGPFAIAHHLISSWVYRDGLDAGAEAKL